MPITTNEQKLINCHEASLIMIKAKDFDDLNKSIDTILENTNAFESSNLPDTDVHKLAICRNAVIDYMDTNKENTSRVCTVRTIAHATKDAVNKAKQYGYQPNTIS